MSVKIDKLVLAPGETATISVVTNIASKSGFYLSDIVVESDAVEKIDEIQIRGQITGQIRVRPLRATILTGEQRASGAFTIFCDDQDGKWNYTGFVSKDPNLEIQLKEKESTPTTSVYEGTVDFKTEEARKNYTAYGETVTTLNFQNNHLGKIFKINLPVDIAVRQKVTVDPPQVMFTARGADQKRTLLVQSVQPLSIDAVRCDSPCVTTAIHRIDPKALTVDLIFLPALSRGELPEDVACELLSDGKTVGSVPIRIVAIP